jgi:tRNA threonylcarbamoyl adenosine modification protein (Sua5/YciO/YrdC/YwlC family)
VSLSASFESVIADGGVVLFPSDTVYGLACSPLLPEAVERLYALKGRAPDKAAAVMFFSVEAASGVLATLGPNTRAAIERLAPAGLTFLIPNPAGMFPLASAGDASTLGLRIVDLPTLADVSVPVLQSSANLAGDPEARTLNQVPESIRAGIELEVDGGVLPGVASTVVDLREYEAEGDWEIVREGAIPAEVVAVALDAIDHFDPDSYAAAIRADLADYEVLQRELLAAATASGIEVRTILDLGTGTGETAAGLLAALPRASLVGVDISASMLDAARSRLPAARVSDLRVARLQDPLPEGPFDLIASALAVHHLTAAEKADLFTRVRAALTPGGRFVLADVIEPADPGDAVIPLTRGYDKPSPLSAQLRWLGEAGFASANVRWSRRDLAVVTAETRA